MRKNWIRLFVATVFIVAATVICAVPCFAISTIEGHVDPDGTTTTYYAYDASECDRTVNVNMYDLNGNFLKKVILKTKRGEDNSFYFGIGGYDIVNFSSDQGLWETCKLQSISGTGLCTEADIFIEYYFRTALSAKTINVTIEMRKWDPIQVEVRHYVEQNPNLKFFYRDNYRLHSTTTYGTLNYNDSFSISKTNITGYTLTDGYLSTVSGKLCYHALVGKYKNTPSSPRCHEYDLHQTSNLTTCSTYKESKNGKIDWCDNRKIWIEFFYDINEYTVSFNANGGSGAPDSLSKYHGYDISIPATIPTRSGYTFKGWGASSTSTTASYQPGGNYTANMGRTLYAIWESNAPKTYTVQYNANGGIGAPSSQTKTHDVTLKLSATKPTRSGYTFAGWATSSSATSATYTAGGNYTANASQTLYAVWVKNITTYTVSYNANGGMGAPFPQVKKQDITLTLSSVKPTRDEYLFAGWSTSSTAISPNYQAGGNYTANASVTLYAVWLYTPTTYTVTYDANGGTGAPESQMKVKNVDLTLSLSVPTRESYLFAGWCTSRTGIMPEYRAGDIYAANASVTLYAVWLYMPTTYTVTYDANGGTGAPSPQMKVKDVALTLSAEIPVRFNYRFRGWSTDSTATLPVYSAGDTYTANANATLYAVWEYDPVTYSVYYDANGGTGAPATQTKRYDEPLTLSSQRPTRPGYDFLGWSTNTTATSATYPPGGSYTANATVTLYAVWQKTNCDFSVSALTVSDSEPYRYDQITVQVRADSWDRVNAYMNIPVQLYYDGRLVSTQYVNFSAYGVANISFTLNVGHATGNKVIEARINWADHENETRTDNNSVSVSIDVQDYEYDMTVEPVYVADAYREGIEVISSFYVRNDSDYDIIPSHHNTARFTAYYYNGTNRIVVCTQDWEDAVIPAGGTNLVYFKWHVPEGLDEKTVYMECTVNADRQINEASYDDNTATFFKMVTAVTQSQTPNTRFEGQAPGSYQQSAVTPSERPGQATWNMWVYENGDFVLKKYGVQISANSPNVAPSADCATAVYENSRWIMRSGYGIIVSYMPVISTASGCLRPDANAHTSAQQVIATFPEYRYDDTNGYCRTLVYVDGSYQFAENVYADRNARLHFIPVYVKDGEYIVSLIVTEMWTPVGIISAVINAAPIVIDGTIYDDWY